MNLRSTLPTLFICMSHHVLAQDDDHNHSLQAHVHGEAEMTMILQNDELAISFESPLANLVGFEHQPETAQQRSAVDAAVIDLQNPDSWVLFDGGNCNLLSALANTSLDLVHAEERHAEEHHTEEHHAEEHHAEEHHAEEHHAEETHAEETHAEFTAEYLYRCDKAEDLKSVSIALQAKYPAIEHIEVQWIINGNQGATELEADENRILFR